MVRAMCGVQLKDRKKSMDLMFMLGLNETIDQLLMANSARWHGDVQRREGGHVLRRALDFEVEREAKDDMEEAGCGGKCGGWFRKGRCSLLIIVECWY